MRTKSSHEGHIDPNPAITGCLNRYPGWWFGTWILWPAIQLGMSSSQLTKSIIFQRGRLKPPTRSIVDLAIEDGDLPFLLENYPQECG